MPPVPLVAFSRGTVDESIHSGSIAIVDASGRLVASAGDPERITTMRSAAKPFQAMAVVEAGVAERFSLTTEEVALIAASHSGEPRHTQLVGALLDRAGLRSEDLQCGTHPPLHQATRAELEKRGQAPTVLHHNCSGKHCGMLCACVACGWDRRTYLRPDHPMQRAAMELIASVVDLPPSGIQVAIDGCGLPTYGVPLRSLALGFARLAHLSGLGGHAASAHQVRDAMIAHPDVVAGEGRLDTDLMRAAPGRLLAKAGAEACYGVALLDRGWGLALKIEDGGARAVSVAVVEALRQVEALTAEEAASVQRHARPLVRNYRDEIVGWGRPVYTLTRL